MRRQAQVLTSKPAICSAAGRFPKFSAPNPPQEGTAAALQLQDRELHDRAPCVAVPAADAPIHSPRARRLLRRATRVAAHRLRQSNTDSPRTGA